MCVVKSAGFVPARPFERKKLFLAHSQHIPECNYLRSCFKVKLVLRIPIYRPCSAIPHHCAHGMFIFHFRFPSIVMSRVMTGKESWSW
jgi:hypothetical protein